MMRRVKWESLFTVQFSDLKFFFFNFNPVRINVCGFFVPSCSCLPYMEFISATRHGDFFFIFLKSDCAGLMFSLQLIIELIF